MKNTNAQHQARALLASMAKSIKADKCTRTQGRSGQGLRRVGGVVVGNAFASLGDGDVGELLALADGRPLGIVPSALLALARKRERG